jgi:hypothetical protein
MLPKARLRMTFKRSVISARLRLEIPVIETFHRFGNLAEVDAGVAICVDAKTVFRERRTHPPKMWQIRT